MSSVVVPIRGRVVVRRGRNEVYIYVSRRELGGRMLARYNGARVDGLVIILSEGGGDVP
jgi:hypothetical protein